MLVCSDCGWTWHVITAWRFATLYLSGSKRGAPWHTDPVIFRCTQAGQAATVHNTRWKCVCVKTWLHVQASLIQLPARLEKYFSLQ